MQKLPRFVALTKPAIVGKGLITIVIPNNQCRDHMVLRFVEELEAVKLDVEVILWNSKMKKLLQQRDCEEFDFLGKHFLLVTVWNGYTPPIFEDGDGRFPCLDQLISEKCTCKFQFRFILTFSGEMLVISTQKDNYSSNSVNGHWILSSSFNHTELCTLLIDMKYKEPKSLFSFELTRFGLVPLPLSILLSIVVIFLLLKFPPHVSTLWSNLLFFSAPVSWLIQCPGLVRTAFYFWWSLDCLSGIIKVWTDPGLIPRFFNYSSWLPPV